MNDSDIAIKTAIHTAYLGFLQWSMLDTNKPNAVRAKKKASELITLLKQYKPI